MSENLRNNNGLMKTDSRMFWVLQATAWVTLGLAWYLFYTYTFGQNELPYVIHPLLQSVLGVFISWPMRYVFRWTWDMGPAIKWPAVILTVLIFALIWTFARLVTFIWLTGESKNFLPEFGLWYFPGLLVFACWAALYHGFKYYRFLQEEHASLLQMEREKQAEILRRQNAEHLAQEAQYKMLRYQLNPHFLFNTMNAIASLINAGRNPEAAQMIDSLSRFLRESLDGDPLRRVTLREELASVKNYLDIEKTRFGKRLKVEIKAAEQDLDFKVPGMLIQPLAENVIKHAVRPAVERVTLTISAHATEDYLQIEVIDTGPGISELSEGEVPRSGIGLKNVRDRLQNMYGSHFRFQLVSEPGKGLNVMIRLPGEREAETVNLPLAVGDHV